MGVLRTVHLPILLHSEYLIAKSRNRKLRKDCLTFCCSNGRKPLNYGKRQDVTLSYNTNRLLDVLVLKFSAVNLARQKLLVVAKCYLWVGLLCTTQDHGVFDFDGCKRPFQEGCSFFRAMSKFTTWLCFKNNTAFSWVTRLRLIPFTYKKKKKPWVANDNSYASFPRWVKVTSSLWVWH